jgi:hypothetical protein
MKKNIVVAGLFLIFFLSKTINAGAQQTLWFGTVKMQDKIIQGRFEVISDSVIKTIVYAPYGISPTTFTEVKQQKNQLTFVWKINHLSYHCLLVKQDSTAYKGNCTCDSEQPIQLIIRQFSEEDAFLQGDSLHATTKDIQILDRALSLLNNGSNWNPFDNRVCDNSSYPYKWSLFCALHQASIDIDAEYGHLRPSNQAVRQAINEITSGKKYAHLLQDYNNEAQSFDSIAKVLNRAKEIISEKIKLHQ